MTPEQLEAIVQRFPALRIVTQHPLGYNVHYVGFGSPGLAAIADQPETFTQRVRYLDLRTRLERTLEAAYPRLSFRVYSTPWLRGQQDRDYDGQDLPTQSWVVLRQELTWTGYEFHWPLTPTIKADLARINREAALAHMLGYQYCPICQRAMPRALFAPGSLACGECADPLVERQGLPHLESALRELLGRDDL